MLSSQRLLRPRWRDSRLAGSAALIALAAVAGGILTSGSDTVAVYQAHSTVLPGTPLAQADLVLVNLPPAAAGAYVSPSDVESHAIIDATIRKGELLAHTAIADTPSDSVRLVLDIAGPVPSAAEPGSRVTIWRIDSAHALGLEAGAAELSADAQIVAASAGDALAHWAELLVPAHAVGPVLEAMGAGAQFVITLGGGQ